MTTAHIMLDLRNRSVQPLSSTDASQSPLGVNGCATRYHPLTPSGFPYPLKIRTDLHFELWDFGNWGFCILHFSFCICFHPPHQPSHRRRHFTRQAIHVHVEVADENVQQHIAQLANLWRRIWIVRHLFHRWK